MAGFNTCCLTGAGKALCSPGMKAVTNQNDPQEALMPLPSSMSKLQLWSCARLPPCRERAAQHCQHGHRKLPSNPAFGSERKETLHRISAANTHNKSCKLHPLRGSAKWGEVRIGKKDVPPGYPGLQAGQHCLFPRNPPCRVLWTQHWSHKAWNVNAVLDLVSSFPGWRHRTSPFVTQNYQTGTEASHLAKILPHFLLGRCWRSCREDHYLL